MTQANVYDKLKELGIELPTAGAPAAAYVMSAQSGNTVYLSGHIAKKDGKVSTGKLGANLTTEEGKAAARSIAIDLLATLHAHVRQPDPRQAHRQADESRELDARFHRAASRHQRRLRTGRRCVRRARQACTLGLRRRPVPLGACVEMR